MGGAKIGSPLAGLSADVLSSSSSTPMKKCKHHERYCDLTFVKQCCACLDKTLRQGKCEANLFMGKKSHAATTTGKPWYSDYCKGCYNFHHSKVEAKIQARQKAFTSWKEDPLSDPGLTGLAFNFFLRKAKLPFEITHLVLSFTFREPPIRFFRTFDRPSSEKAILKSRLSDAEAANFNKPTEESRQKAQQRAGRCTHSCCNNFDPRESRTYTRSYYSSRRSYRGCCVCLDARPDPHVDAVYVDGTGNVVKEVDFFQHYCSGCRDYWGARPGVHPFTSSETNTNISVEEKIAVAAVAATSAPVKKKATTSSTTGGGITFVSNRAR